ncbi:MAG: hypothetical protein LBU37_05435 [Tannerellaceae bacterium]|jgi:hypothetical protein|nr:hypothetical protein [Tannerellaceae bacterium]
MKESGRNYDSPPCRLQAMEWPYRNEQFSHTDFNSLMIAMRKTLLREA